MRRPGRLGWILIGAGAFLAAWLALIAGNSIGRYVGWIVTSGPPQALADTLRPFYRVVKPEGEGPFPTALLYSGCDGPHDNLDAWAEMLRARGWAAIIVDSHGPRNFVGGEVWRLICAGQLLMGSERAGDVLVSIADARATPFVDADRLALIGASHGAWAIMELLVFADAGALPYGLSALPEGAAEAPLAGVAAIVFVYPYCGPANRAGRTGWRFEAPTLFLLAGADVIADPKRCLALARLLEAEGVPVETRTFGGATHGFDQRDRSPVSALTFDPEATAAALAAAGAFLDRAAGRRTAQAVGRAAY